MPAFSNSSDMKSVFAKLRFRDGLAWTVGLAVEIKLRFEIPPVWCGRGLGIQRYYFIYIDQKLSTNPSAFLKKVACLQPEKTFQF